MPREPFSFRQQPPSVKALMAVHAGVYLAQWIAWEPVTAFLGLSPARVTGSLWLWQPFTYVFLHAIGVFGFFFFLIHMYLLSTLGRDLAYRWGSAGFTFYYMACGAAGAAVITALGPWAPSLVLGSSTVILGLLAAFATIAPGAEIMFYFMPMTAQQLVLLMAGLEILLAVARMMPAAEVAGHLTAMAAGYGLVKSRWLDGRLLRAWREWIDRRRAERGHLHVVDMENEVDRILDKVLKKGSASLTRREQELMQRYSKSKK